LYAVESLIEHLKEQIRIAPELRQNDEPGGTQHDMLARLQEGVNFAGEVDCLKAVEGGVRRYRKALEATIARLEPLTPVWADIEAVVNARYGDGEQRQKATNRIKDRAAIIKSACEGAIAELQSALKVIEEGEARAVRVK